MGVNPTIASPSRTLWATLGRWGSNFVSWLIFLNIIAIALSTYPSLDQWDPIFLGFDKLCIGVFIIEMLIRIAVGGKKFWVGEHTFWNYFDLLVTIISSISIIPGLSALRAARAIRLLLSMRVLHSVKNLRILITSIGKSLPNIGWLFLLLMFFNAIYTVIGTLLFAEDAPELFGRIHLSFYTMIELMTMEGWNETARTVMEAHPYAWIFFLSYMAITAYILLNAVAGVVVDCIMSPSTEESKVREIDMIERQQQMAETIERLEAKVDALTKQLIQK